MPQFDQTTKAKDNMSSTTLNVPELVAPMYETHKSGVNYSWKWRQSNLKKMKEMLVNHKDEWLDALYQDLHKCPAEACLSEFGFCVSEVDYFLAHTQELMRPTPVNTPLALAPAFSHAQHIPRRAPAVLVIGPFNYPLVLNYFPIVGALAAGNPVVFKPSEMCEATSNLWARLAAQYFDRGSFRVVLGGKEVATELLKQEYGLIFFTGSQRVGKIIAAAASQTLTPTVLELGGKSPVYVDEKLPWDAQLIASRIIWGKTFNSGQSCIAPDYLVIHEKHADKIIPLLVKALDMQFPKGDYSEMARIVQPEYAKRHIEMLKEVESRGATVLVGGLSKCNAQKKFTAPTLLKDVPPGSRLMRDEIFGPILPIFVVKSRKEALGFINSQPGQPLAMYVFTSDGGFFTKMLETVHCAGAIRNDVMVHLAVDELPFGGCGTSGYGCYHGKYSFDAFSTVQGRVYRPCIAGSDFGYARYHPYKGLREKIAPILVGLPKVPVMRPWLIVGVVVLAAFYYLPLGPVLLEGLAEILVNLASSMREILEQTS